MLLEGELCLVVYKNKRKERGWKTERGQKVGKQCVIDQRIGGSGAPLLGDRTLIGGVRRAMAQVGKAWAVVDDSGEAGHLFFGQGHPVVFSVSH